MKYKNKWCETKMTFHECELAILRHVVDEIETTQTQNIINDKNVKDMMKIVEQFIIHKKLICYGGTAINNILPKTKQFYNKDTEIPDYDFYSWNALDHAKKLADVFHRAGYTDIEAKTGIHVGTFKVFVNAISVADITYLPKSLFNSIQKEAIIIKGIRYSPPNLLRMNMYLELSRPAGEVSRWEKVLKRLTLLNECFPMKSALKCVFQRTEDKMYDIVRDSLIEQGVIFFGGYASNLYTKQTQISDFDALSNNPDECAMVVKNRMSDAGFHVKLIHHKEIGEIIPKSIELIVNNETVAFIYEPIACHSYNTVNIDGKLVNIATIDTCLSFYFAFYYADKPYYNKDRILCISELLFEIEQKHRLDQTGILNRFSMNCYGNQKTLEDIRAEKNDKYKQIKGKHSTEYEIWFLNYNPAAFLPKSTKASPYRTVNKRTKLRKTRKR